MRVALRHPLPGPQKESMSALYYQLTIMDQHGNVLDERMHTSISLLVQELPEIRKQAEEKLKEKEERWLYRQVRHIDI